jgi:prepilin-type N-terminal cleavage/methylation domain-containing protein
MDRRQKKTLLRRQDRLAFTLLEMLIALSMLALILGAVYGSYRATTESVARCRPKSTLQQQARIFLQRLTQQIRCCYAGRPVESDDSRRKARTPEKVLKKANPPLFLAKPIRPGQTFLRCVTSTVTLRQNRSYGGLVIVSYRLDESGTVLLRSERRYLADGFEAGDDDYEWFVVFENVSTLEFEYFNGDKWLQQWDSNQMKGLPQAVRVTLVFQPEGRSPVSFVSTAPIVCRGGKQMQKVKVKNQNLSDDSQD